MANPPQNYDLSSLLVGESMDFIGFKPDLVSSDCVQGRFVVSERSCQPFRVLHGGVSALIAESLASTGAVVASGFQRVAGIQLTINHIKAAPIGTEVVASAKPVHLGKRIHVWDVTFSKADSQSASEQNPSGTMIAVSRVTLMVGLSTENDPILKQYARL